MTGAVMERGSLEKGTHVGVCPVRRCRENISALAGWLAHHPNMPRLQVQSLVQVQEAANECINKWNETLMSLPPLHPPPSPSSLCLSLSLKKSERPGKDFSPTSLRKRQPCGHLACRLLDSRLLDDRFLLLKPLGLWSLVREL